jgi:hypothetical protein
VEYASRLLLEDERVGLAGMPIKAKALTGECAQKWVATPDSCLGRAADTVTPLFPARLALRGERLWLSSAGWWRFEKTAGEPMRS